MNATMNYSIIDNATMFSFCKHALSLFGNEENIAPTLLPFYNKVKLHYKVILNAFKRESVDPYTEKKAKADINRRTSFNAFKLFVKACNNSLNKSLRTAGKTLLLVIKKHTKNISNPGYKRQSSIEISIIDEIRKDHLQELELCNATVWFEEMENSQNIFESITRESLNFDHKDKPKLGDTRRLMDKDIRSLFNLVDLLSQSTPSDELTSLNRNLNQLASEIMASARSVNTRKRNQSKNDIENDVGKEGEVES